LLLDEHIWLSLAGILKSEGFDALHITEAHLSGANDDIVLEYAANNGRALLTFNAKDFIELNNQWSSLRKEHDGIIISSQVSKEVLHARIKKLLDTKSPDSMRSNIDFLNNYK
jgi:predicted nuclease of predicted toxin-antitoxin system